MSSTEENQPIANNTDTQTTRNAIELEKTEELLINMAKDPNLLKQGYSLFSNFEKFRNFYINFLKVIFLSSHEIKVKKLASSTLKIYLMKNWSDDEYITNEERLVSAIVILY